MDLDTPRPPEPAFSTARERGDAPRGKRGRRRRRVFAVVVVAALAFGGGIVLGSRHENKAEKKVKQFALAWNRGNFTAMHALLTDSAAATYPQNAFTSSYEAALDTATATGQGTGLSAGIPRHAGKAWAIPVVVRTRIFGVVRGTVTITAQDGGVVWDQSLVFPGLTPGHHLHAITHMAPRGTLLARDGSVLAKGKTRTGAASDVSGQVVGELGPIPAADAAADKTLGFPKDAKVGVSGLERIFNDELVGKPGGELLAGSTVLAKVHSKQAHAVRTSISLPVERAAITALAGRLGGVVAASPKTGQILAFAGIAFSGLQPPGSTFKVVTTTGALAAGITSPSKTYEYASYATLSGVKLANANNEVCGGTLALSFATSCNSVFAPLGAQLGAKKLVSMAEKFGFNHPTGITGAAESTLPEADAIGDDLAVGSSAIGQGKVQATTLQMALVAATIADHGRRPHPTLLWSATPKPPITTKVTSTTVARTMRDLMIGVVREGTGVNAAIPGVVVAGKTGTAELQSTQPCTPAQTGTTTTPVSNPENCAQNPNDPTLTDAWFTSFAPAGKPRIVVCVMLVKDGAGGDTAAPAAKGVLEAGLDATG